MNANATILVVDDTPANVRLLVGLLKDQGYTVRPARSGQHALTVAQTNPVDLLLLDIKMPEMDGYEVCRRLKAQETTHDIPIIFLSALNDTFDKVKAFEVGGVDYITKPFQPEEVLARVETHLSLRRMHRQLQHHNTQLQHQKAQLQHQKTQLQQEIAERKRVEDALREANATKDTFFSIIAHDLRSPFTALLGSADLAIISFESPNQEELKNHIVQIKTSAEAVYALLRNLLTWSCIQRGVMDYQPINFLLCRLIEEVCYVLASSAKHKQIVLDAHIPEAMMGYADPNMVNTVMRNLVSNALKFTFPGGSIAISAQQRETAVDISVSDTGMGIPEDMLPNVFRVDVKTTTIGTNGERGTGLGLPLCKDLIEKNGGTIRVTSTPGQGTIFILTIPSPSKSLQDDMHTVHEYSGETAPEPHQMSHASVITSETLSATIARLPQAWQTELRHAAETLDLEAVTSIIERIRPQDELLADALTRIVQQYQFNILQETFERMES